MKYLMPGIKIYSRKNKPGRGTDPATRLSYPVLTEPAPLLTSAKKTEAGRTLKTE
jgi:hypothetical protein